MKKVKYIINGFDCPNCAAKSEEYLKKTGLFENVSIDFNNSFIYLTFKDKPLEKEQVLALIQESTDDEIELNEPEHGHNHDHHGKLFTKDTIILLIRIVISLAFIIAAKIIEENLDMFWLTLGLYIAGYLVIVYDIVWEVIENIIHLRNPIDEHLLMVMASVGAFLLVLFPEAESAFFDGVLVIILYQIGEVIEHVITHNSRKAISTAIDIRAKTANLVKGNEIEVVDPSALVVGDEIIIKVGEIVPVDGIVIKGSGNLDVSSLTGEPLPIAIDEGSAVLSGTILKSGSLTVRVEKEYKDSTVSKVLDLVQSSGERKAKLDRFITKFARIYTPAVLGIAIVFAVIFGFATGSWSTALYRGISILVIACPCAIVISVPLAYFAGIGLASKNGIVVKGANYLEALANSGVLFIDKTGTLTYGNFKVTKIESVVDPSEFEKALIIAESKSNHPLSKAILDGKDLSALNLPNIEYEEVAGGGVIAKYENYEYHAGSRFFLENNGIKVPEINEPGTIVCLAKNKCYLGYLVLEDEIRHNAKHLVEKLHQLGIKVIVLSGDNEINVKRVAEQIGIDEYHANLLPEDKTRFVEAQFNQKNIKKSVLFAGDGINDTPSIKRADIGFAMGGVGSDAAIENADILIMHDDPMKIHQSIRIGKITRHTALFNVVFAITIKVVVMILAATIPNFPIEIDVAADTGLTILLVINSLLVFYRKIKK